MMPELIERLETPAWETVWEAPEWRIDQEIFVIQGTGHRRPNVSADGFELFRLNPDFPGCDEWGSSQPKWEKVAGWQVESPTVKLPASVRAAWEELAGND